MPTIKGGVMGYVLLKIRSGPTDHDLAASKEQHKPIELHVEDQFGKDFFLKVYRIENICNDGHPNRRSILGILILSATDRNSCGLTRDECYPKFHASYDVATKQGTLTIA